MEAARFRTVTKTLGLFSNKRVNLKLGRKKKKKKKSTKSSHRIEADQCAIGNNTVMKLSTDLENILDSLKALKVDSPSTYE